MVVDCAACLGVVSVHTPRNKPGGHHAVQMGARGCPCRSRHSVVPCDLRRTSSSFDRPSYLLLEPLAPVPIEPLSGIKSRKEYSHIREHLDEGEREKNTRSRIGERCSSAVYQRASFVARSVVLDVIVSKVCSALSRG